MQTKDMWKGNRWKVVAGAATLSALGVGGLAIAAPGSDDKAPRSIDLEDRRIQVAQPQVPTTDTLVDFLDFDSPFGDSPSPDSPSPDSPSPDAVPQIDVSGSPDSPSPDSPDSPESPESPDDSPVPAPAASDLPDDSGSVDTDSFSASASGSADGSSDS